MRSESKFSAYTSNPALAFLLSFQPKSFWPFPYIAPSKKKVYSINHFLLVFLFSLKTIDSLIKTLQSLFQISAYNLYMISIPDSLAWAHPLVRDWFTNKYNSPTEPQEQGWPSILAGLTTLISAPTGSGKTFAAFLICIDQLVRQSLMDLPDQTSVVYISPLKALTNDIQKNLLEPLEEIQRLAKERGLLMKEIQVAVRTGDTLAKDRQAMLKNPLIFLLPPPNRFIYCLRQKKAAPFLKTLKQ